MLQLPVTKQGRFSITHFDDRIATFDSGQRSVFLSRKKHPEELWYHKLVVNEVTLWPEFNYMLVDEKLESREAMLTIKVAGVEVQTTHVDRMRVLGCSQKGDNQRCNLYFPDNERNGLGRLGRLHHTDEHRETPRISDNGRIDRGAVSEFPSAVSAEPPPHVEVREVNTTEAPPPPLRSVPNTAGGTARYWVLRCTSVATLRQLVEAFEFLQQRELGVAPVTASSAAAADAHVSRVLPRIVGDLDFVRNTVTRYDGEGEQMFTAANGVRP